MLIAALALLTLGDLVAIALKSRAPGKLSEGDQGLADLAQGLPALVYLPALVATIVTLLMWLHRAYRNLPALGAQKPRFSPRWAVGAWFVPILSIWRPYQIVREVWQVSSPGREWGLVKWWWGLWLVSEYVDQIVFRIGLKSDAIWHDGLDILSNLLDMVAAILAMLVVRAITDAQEARARQNIPTSTG